MLFKGVGMPKGDGILLRWSPFKKMATRQDIDRVRQHMQLKDMGPGKRGMVWRQGQM